MARPWRTVGQPWPTSRCGACIACRRITLLTERIEHLRRTSQLPRFIAVEGPIGVGKTTLSQRLAETFGFDTLLERAEDNPFLARFYRDPARYALQTELF